MTNERINAVIADLRGYCPLIHECRILKRQLMEEDEMSYGLRSTGKISGNSSFQGTDRIYWLMRKEETASLLQEKQKKLEETERKIERIATSADGPLLYRVYVKNEPMRKVARDYGILPGSLYKRLHKALITCFAE